jgi:hypothetical protein
MLIRVADAEKYYARVLEINAICPSTLAALKLDGKINHR